MIVVGIIIALGICAVIYLKWRAEQKRARDIVLTSFRSGNVIVAGHKGTGKDLLFNFVITERERDGEIHASNIRYTDQTHILSPQHFMLNDNTISNFVSNKFSRESKHFTEKEDYYISEAGLAFPNWARAELEKKYRSLPITFALSRHLGDFSIHANVQNYTRLWDKLREQADTYIWCEHATVRGKKVSQTFVIYNRAESAIDHIQPFECRRNFWGAKVKEDKAYAVTFNAKYGYIERLTLKYKLADKPYDTRAFYKALYMEHPPQVNKKGEHTHHRHRVVQTDDAAKKK